MALVTADEAKVALRAIGGTGDDTALDNAIARADQMMAAWCGFPMTTTGIRTLESASYVLEVDGDGTRDLYLPIRPVTAVASVYDDTQWTWSSDDLVASSDYALDTYKGRIRLTETASHGVFAEGDGNVKVTCTAGFSTVPEAIKQACILMVRHIWRLQADQGVENRSEGGGSATYRSEDIPDGVKRLLSPFRIMSGGLRYAV